MNAMSEAVKNLEVAIDILEQHVKDPQNQNTYYAEDLESINWELYKHMREVRRISNRYGVL